MTVTPDPQFIASIQAANVAVGGPQTIIADGQPIVAPTLAEVLAYLANVRAHYQRWADTSDEPATDAPDEAASDGDAPDHDASDDGAKQAQRVVSEPDLFIEMRALPMRLAAYRPQPGAGDAPTVELLSAVQNAQRTFILGEPGSGKSAALERLAWVTASHSLQRAHREADAPVVVPLLARLADYRGEADLIPLLRRALNQLGPWQLGDGSVRLLLWARNLRFVLLLDGLNEIERAQVGAGRKALRGHRSDYRQHVLHLSCRTADFDAEQEANPELQVLPDAQLWTVQELLDTIAYWGDADGESDVRDYLRFHLGEANGRRLYAQLRQDERLTSLVRLPLFLWMFKEAAGEGDGELPRNRGELLRGFVRAPRVLGRIAKGERALVEQCLETLGWQLQQAGVLQCDGTTLYRALAEARGQQSQPPDALREALKQSGLLLDLGDERYKFLHQLLQEYAAAAHLLRRGQTAAQVPALGQDEWWREPCQVALWLDQSLHTPPYLLGLMDNASVDLRVRVAAATILGEVGDPRFVRKRYANNVEAIEPAMVRIPAGQAILGGEDDEAYDGEKPQCRVAIRAFDLAVYPVTNAEFACFVDAGAYDDPTLWTRAGQAWLRGEVALDPETEQTLRRLFQNFSQDVEGWIARTKQTQALDDASAASYRHIAAHYSEDEYVQAYAQQVLGEQRRTPYYWDDSRFNHPTQPVVGVNWYEAMAYAAWLTRVSGQAYCLPSEAEWEWAVRRWAAPRFWSWGTRRHDRRYPWGNAWDGARCNWRGSGLNRPNPVGVYHQGRTDDGLHELAGNVYEWTLSLYRPYPYQPTDGREEIEDEGLRVLRGGSWYVDRTNVRCAYRDRDLPWNGSNNYGFRLARASL
ncbi:MAG: SUMF1/EgtB/PvdO family nonheme iron enzyme [Caldilineaceae bacterium]